MGSAHAKGRNAPEDPRCGGDPALSCSTRNRSAAQRPVLVLRPGAAHVILELSIQVLGLHIDCARPVFGSVGGIDELVEQLLVPGVELNLRDRAVEVLNFDGLIVVVDGDNFKELVSPAAIPLTYDRLDDDSSRILLHCRDQFNSQ